MPVHCGGGRNAAHQPGPGRQRLLLGIAKIHRYGRNVRAVSWEQVSQARKDRMARELSTLAKRVERGVGKVRPGLRTKAFLP